MNHHYGPAEDLERECERLRSLTERPLLCTEYLARPLHSRFETHLPIFHERRIGAIHWGLVSGRTQTIYAWLSWVTMDPAQADPWFHDIFHPDGAPYDPGEVALIQDLTGR